MHDAGAARDHDNGIVQKHVNGIDNYNGGIKSIYSRIASRRCSSSSSSRNKSNTTTRNIIKENKERFSNKKLTRNNNVNSKIRDNSNNNNNCKYLYRSSTTSDTNFINENLKHKDNTVQQSTANPSNTFYNRPKSQQYTRRSSSSLYTMR